MPRSWPLTQPLRFSLNRETIAILDKMALTGLYGRDRGDVARTLISEGIRRAIAADPGLFTDGGRTYVEREGN